MSGRTQKRGARLGLVAGLVFALLGVAGASSERLLLLDMDGRTHDADALLAAGQPVVLVFWQTWCPTCKREAPELAHAVEKYGDAMKFFGVVSGPDDVIDDAKVLRVAEEWGHRHPQIRDRDLSLTNRFKVIGTPAIIVLGREGRELYRGHRLPKDWVAFVSAPPAKAAPTR
ncbi:MAG: TlpA family protein disulfide reductase [Deltaproteobacteria bacterium]|nr:TlpA family protein disulfide reductase [Deltaproteobacteria bacterium]